MSGLRFGWIVALIFSGGLLAWGLRTGVMPGQAVDVVRSKHPFSFWLLGAGYALTSALCLYGIYAG